MKLVGKSGSVVRLLANWFGTRVFDEETGLFLGRTFIFSWRGRIFLVGYTGSVPLRPVVRRDRRLNYWKLTLGFTAPKEPDFRRIP